MRHVHGEATECIVFMGRQWNASCSWGGNRMHRVHREGLDETSNGNEAWRTAERRKRPCVRPATFETGSRSSGGVWRTAKWRKRTSYVRNGVLLIGRGLAYCKTEETDILWSKRGPVDREGCGVPQNGRNGPPTIETGVLLIRRGVAYRKTDETDLLRSKRGSC